MTTQKTMFSAANGAMFDIAIVGAIVTPNETTMQYPDRGNQLMHAEEISGWQDGKSRLTRLASRIDSLLPERALILPRTNEIVLPSMVGVLSIQPLTKGGFAVRLADKTARHGLLALIRTTTDDEAKAIRDEIKVGIRDFARTMPENFERLLEMPTGDLIAPSIIGLVKQTRTGVALCDSSGTRENMILHVTCQDEQRMQLNDLLRSAFTVVSGDVPPDEEGEEHFAGAGGTADRTAA
jgi:hypothetical protein